MYLAKHQNYFYWPKHLIIPSLLMFLLLSIPVQWQNDSQQLHPTISIELKQVEAKIKISKPEKISLLKPVTNPKPVIQPETIKPESPVIKALITKNAMPKPKNSITSSQIFYSASKIINEKSLPKEFQKAVKKSAYIKRTPETFNWRADIPYLDETIDQPRVEMNFYSAGMAGSVEKFFDKITIEKEFTTKYGTKISCAMIGVLVACGWK